MQPGAITEPNNITGTEMCGLGNYSQTYGSAWGWADADCSTRAPFICKVRPPLAAPAYTAASKNTFFLNTSEVGFMDAETACRANGGHLASFKDIKEQAEVERWYTAGTWLLPKYHQVYWTGYSTAKGWPNFTPMDGTVRGGYSHWGIFTPGVGSSQKEPNSLDANYPLDCAAANFSQAYGAPTAWGWADDKCTNKHIFLCRNACGWQPWQGSAAAAVPAVVSRALCIW
jgi:hypothetical protein